MSGPTTSAAGPLTALDWTLVTDGVKFLVRWAKYFSALFNKVKPTDPSAFDKLPQLPVATGIDIKITQVEVTEAINSLKAGKAAGTVGLPMMTSSMAALQ